MTSLYNESSVAGTSYKRARLAELNNQKDMLPKITFVEEEITNLTNGTTFSRDVENLIVDFDANGSIPLYDMITQQPTGESVTHQYFYQILYSLYISAALARDNERNQA